jgi:hypothetical protein
MTQPGALHLVSIDRRRAAGLSYRTNALRGALRVSCWGDAELHEYRVGEDVRRADQLRLRRRAVSKTGSCSVMTGLYAQVAACPFRRCVFREQPGGLK